MSEPFNSDFVGQEASLDDDLRALGWRYDGRRSRGGSMRWYASCADKTRLKPHAEHILGAHSPFQLLRRAKSTLRTDATTETTTVSVKHVGDNNEGEG